MFRSVLTVSPSSPADFTSRTTPAPAPEAILLLTLLLSVTPATATQHAKTKHKTQGRQKTTLLCACTLHTVKQSIVSVCCVSYGYLHHRCPRLLPQLRPGLRARVRTRLLHAPLAPLLPCSPLPSAQTEAQSSLK